MKFVQKGGLPHGYRTWCRNVHGTNKEDYRELPGGIKSLLLAALSREQGGICAYTMKRIDKDTAHIEHVKPETLCRADEIGSDLDYSNMVSCFPRIGMGRECRFGAQKKSDWWIPELFVSPLHPACEQRFRFRRNGEIHAVGNNAAAVNTISVLGLNHPSLMEDRRRVIGEIIYGQSGNDPLSKAKALRLREQICVRSDGRFIEFCIALRDALDEYLKFTEKIARKKMFSRRRN